MEEPGLSLRTACAALRWESVAERLMHTRQIQFSQLAARQRRDRFRMWHELTCRIRRIAFKRRLLTGLTQLLTIINQRRMESHLGSDRAGTAPRGRNLP